MSTELEILIDAGGVLWEKSGMKRVYFNPAVIQKAIGLDVSYYNTGNVSSATMRGEKISNSKARSIIYEIFAGKLWFDFSDGLFHVKRMINYGSLVKKGVKKLVDEMVKKVVKK